MALNKFKFDVGSPERLLLFGPSRHLLQASDAELYVDEVDCSALAIGAELTVKVQPTMAHSLAFVAPIAKTFTATFEVRGYDGFGEPFVETVVISGDAGADGLDGTGWPLEQSTIPCMWIDSIKLTAYSEASGTGAGTVSVGLVQGENIGAVYYDGERVAIQAPWGLTNFQVYMTTEQIAAGTLNTEPRESVQVNVATGRTILAQLLADPDREINMRVRPDIRTPR